MAIESFAASAFAGTAEGMSLGSEALLIGQVTLLIVAGWLLGEAMLRLGQPAVMGQLLAGVLLGPSVLGLLWPDAQQFLFPNSVAQKNMLDGLAQFGILLLLLLAGMETELALVRDVRRAALSASVSGIVLPFSCGFLLGQFLPDALLPEPEKRLITSLFLGTALAISSVKIVASVVRDMGFLRRNVGQVILASAIIDDTIGWIIIAITLGLAGEANVNWISVAKTLIGTLLFLALSFTFGRRLVFKTIQLTNDHFGGEAPVIAAILGLTGAFALVTHLIGVHAVLGAFVAGILVGESPILTIEINRQLRGLVAALFMPVFFGLAGLTADLSVLKDPDLALLTLGLVAIASIGKAAGAFAGGWFGGLTAKESTALAMGMNARGSTEIMVASIGLSMGVLSHNLFTMIVAMAVITTMAMPPTLRWALQRLPVRREEKKRLAREQYESRAFVPSVERILLGIDGPNNGRFSSQIVGLLAGSRNTPVTVLNLDGSKGEAGLIASAKSETDPAVEAVQGVVAAAGAAKPRDSIAPKIDVIKREHDAPAAEAIIAEAQRGYDLLVLGVEQITSSDGEFHSRISALTAAFEGSIAIVAARGQHERDPTRPPKKILVPITGNENSLRGAEIAMAVAKSAGAEVVALSVISPEAKNKRRGRRETEAVAKEIKKVAGHYEARVTTAVRFDVSAVDAILQMIERGKHDLVAIGVSRRPGDVLSFGEVAHSLLRSAKCSLIFIAPQVRTGRAP